ncbi:MAG: hypothetical protein IJF88_05270 [Oscillospiraceae bacterium]|nr:hypothetical protein [Oscillospiraceae bacterium]MBR3861341.1 hypothetical protein [Oscillospiraceae bacterium]MBR6095538.1 hypothetical protein [Oscillospiraceae bacterium]MBR7055504.1 hypothetical protein [Oscillospiraceae bacterium]
MKKTVYFATDYYDRKVIQRIIEKYNLPPLEAARRFLTSQTHELLEDAECGLLCFPERAVFDMWEAEQITGDPRESAYIRGE